MSPAPSRCSRVGRPCTFPSPNGGLLVFTIMADGNPACASYNGASCLWGVPLAQIDLARLKPLVCGEAHRALWGKPRVTKIPATGADGSPPVSTCAFHSRVTEGPGSGLCLVVRRGQVKFCGRSGPAFGSRFRPYSGFTSSDRRSDAGSARDAARAGQQRRHRRDDEHDRRGRPSTSGSARDVSNSSDCSQRPPMTAATQPATMPAPASRIASRRIIR